MLVTVLELRATWGESARVLDEVGAMLAAGPVTELVLMPEASIHGYVSAERDFDLTRFAEPIEGPTAARCAEIARAARVHLVAPLVLREGGALYNAMGCWGPGGERVFVYRKRHPWVPETWATPGAAPLPVVEIRGRRVAIAICYDLQFIEEDSRAELAAAELLLFPSAWVERPDSRPARLASLAREFDLHVANANWAPGVVRVPGQGGSSIVAPDGTVLARATGPGRIDAEV